MSSPAVPAVDPAWLVEAKKLKGLTEIVGSRHEAKVLQFFAEAGHPEVKNDETAWCAAFANAMLRRAGWAGTGALNARSFLNWGTKLTKPQLGCIVVYKRGNSSWEGHVNFFTRQVGSKIYGIGGNQSNAVNETAFEADKVLGYRWPLIKSVTKVVPVAMPVPAPTKPVTKKDAAVVAGTTVIVGGAAAAAQQGISAMEILAWIGGISGSAIAAIILGYRAYKGHWPWTGNQSSELLLPSPQPSEKSLELASAQLALSSADSLATPSPKSSVSSQRRKQSAKPSRKTPTRQTSSVTSKKRAAKKSSPKRKSKSKS